MSKYNLFHISGLRTKVLNIALSPHKKNSFCHLFTFKRFLRLPCSFIITCLHYFFAKQKCCSHKSLGQKGLTKRDTRGASCKTLAYRSTKTSLSGRFSNNNKKQSGDILPISLCQGMMSKEVSVNRKYLKTKQQLTMSERKLWHFHQRGITFISTRENEKPNNKFNKNRQLKRK